MRGFLRPRVGLTICWKDSRNSELFFLGLSQCKTQTEVSKGLGRIEQSLRETRCPLPGVSCRRGLICVATMCDSTYGVWPTKDAHVSLRVYIGHVSVAGHPCSRPYSVSSPSRGQTDTVCLKVPTTSLIVSADYLRQPQNTPTSRRFQGLGGPFPRATEECAGCGQTSPAESASDCAADLGPQTS